MEKLFNEKETAKILGLSESTIRKNRMEGNKGLYFIPFIKIGKAVRYAESDLNKFIRRLRRNR